MARKSLADELQSLINPEPTFADPEDDENFDASSTWLDSGERAHEADISSRSELRKKQVSFLSSVNKKYSGKAISRKDLFNSDEEDDGDMDDDEEDDEEDDDENSNIIDEDEENIEMDEFDEEDEEQADEEDDEEEDDLEELDDEEMMRAAQKQASRQQNGHKKVDEDDDSLHIIQFDTDKQIEKANSVKSQLIMYDSLLDTRIKMQKLLQNCNRLPPATNLLKLRRKKNQQMDELLNEAVKGVRKLGKVLLEIDSFVDLKMADEGQSSETGKRKQSPINYDEDSLSKRFATVASQYGPIINNWHEKTRFVNANVKLKKFDNFDIAPTKAIEQILSDKGRLIAKTRQKRSQFDVIGQGPAGSDMKTNSKSEMNDKNEESESQFHMEIFDDEDFYHQLLKQIIENKVGSVDETSTASRKFVEIQRMRNKLKKIVETRASKGRMMRYNVHEKLVNYMAPIDQTTMEDDAKDKLFKALFGTFSSAQNS